MVRNVRRYREGLTDSERSDGFARPDDVMISTPCPGMRANADTTAPDEGIGLLTDWDKFFNAGTSGQWRTVLTPDDLRRY